MLWLVQITQESLGLCLHVGNQINYSVGVSHLVVIPGNKLDKGLAQLDSSLGIEDGGPHISDKVAGNQILIAVAKNALHLVLRGSLQCGADLLVAGLLGQSHGQVDNGNVSGGNTESHTCQLAVQLGDDLADSLSGASGGGNDVLGSSTATTPVLAAWAINGLLCGCDGVNRSHQTFYNSVFVVDDLGEGSQAVSGAGRVGHNLEAGVVLLVVHTHHEHRSISRGSRDDNLYKFEL